MSKTEKVEQNEPSDDELLAELEEELQKEENATSQNTFKNDTTINNDTSNSDSSGQLTAFQENIITTGSEVSIILLLLLLLLFIIQAIRKIYKHFSLQKAIERVQSAKNEAKQRKAEEFTPIAMDIDPKSYAVYNTEFDKRRDYEILKAKKQLSSKPKLKNLLLNRAINCLERFATLQRDGAGIRKNWNLDLLPKDVWDDYQLAQKSINEEFQSIHNENINQSFEWGKYKQDIFACAREMLGQKVNIKKQEYQNRMRQLHKKNAPSPSNFGNGFEKGFLRNNNDNKLKNDGSGKLSRKQRQELKKQKKQQQVEQRAALTEPRKRKLKRRFANK